MTAARIARRKAARPGRRSSAGGDPARLVAPHPWLKPSAKQPLEALSARSATPGRPASSKSRPLLPVQSTIPKMSASAKSP